jgi:hypothetical protein
MDDNKLELLLKAFAINLGADITSCAEGNIECLEGLISQLLNGDAYTLFQQYYNYTDGNSIEM